MVDADLDREDSSSQADVLSVESTIKHGVLCQVLLGPTSGLPGAPRDACNAVDFCMSLWVCSDRLVRSSLTLPCYQLESLESSKGVG